MKKLFFLPFLFMGIFFLFFVGGGTNQEERHSGDSGYATVGLSPEVLRYKPLVEKYCQLNGIPEKVSIILAIMMQESGGRVADVMQSSESLGLPVNTLGPEESIAQGVKYFAQLLHSAKDENTAIQSYNFGCGFISWLGDKGESYTIELAQRFSTEMALKMGWKNYGDSQYVPHVRRYLMGMTLGDDFSQQVLGEALKYQGYPYVFGGVAPLAFDCSSLTQWCYKTAGVNIPRIAQAQYDSMKSIDLTEAQAGDLVFFHSTYATSDYITHVGIYVGNNQMYHAGDPLGYADLTTSYWQAHLVGAGTVR